jgi:superfamily II helicase
MTETINESNDVSVANPLGDTLESPVVEVTAKPKTLLEEAEEELEKVKPSSDPDFWAKRNCKHCYGRGIEGTATITFQKTNKYKTSLLCVCARKNWTKFRAAWIQQWLADRGHTGSITV